MPTYVGFVFPMILPTKKIEKKLLKKNYTHVIGVDEVGMGCLAGPVVVCAVILDKKFFNKEHGKLRRLRDSKLLSAKQRETFAQQLLKENNMKHKISYCFPKTIDRLNIYKASRLAMRRAVLKLAEGRPPRLQRTALCILVDGPHKIPGLNLDQIPIVKGDRRVFSIACASIIAKVYRDKMMIKYAKRYLNYGFEKHKGYGTKHHVAQLTALGPSKIHRRSFAPISKLG